MPFLDLYLKLQRDVDAHIGAVLDTLACRPDVAANTVVVFTSDHGEYGASHGMRGKGGGAYEEAIRVPLIVRDPRGSAHAGARGQPRTGLTSSVDVAPLLLTSPPAPPPGAGTATTRTSPPASTSPRCWPTPAPGRDYVLHATDETVTEFALEPYAADAPLHVVALRTPKAKYATYSNCAPAASSCRTAGREPELYDYSTPRRSLELDNEAGDSAQEPMLTRCSSGRSRRVARAFAVRLHRARRHGLRDYFKTASRAAGKATERRRERAEREFEEEAPFSEEPILRQRSQRHKLLRQMASGPRVAPAGGWAEGVRARVLARPRCAGLRAWHGV